MNVTWLKDAERILLGKRVLSFSQNDTSVLVQCSDNSSYHGDILVGADGAYSAVRQQLYNALKLDKKLPASDDVSLPYSCVCLVGQTEVLDPEEFPQMKSDIAQNYSVLGASTMCSANTLCWVVIKFLDKESSKQNDSFRCSEWGPEAAEAMAKEVRHFKVPGGKDAKVLTLGDYIDKTPKHLISKVMLEEIVFDTWFSGRTVLMGDACHKMNPSGGSGAITAIHDAVTLANWISTLRSGTVNGIEKVFKEYRDERHPVAKKAYEASQMFHRTFGNCFVSVVVRGLMKRLPHWLWRRIILKMFSAKLQASFLPLVEDNAPVRSSYQASLQKTLPILKKFQEESAIQGTLSSVPIAV
ncbi:hypothetical protein BGZ74_003716 [Mortierella antarctica]|nr:hypothetical protein BGZ74_003716 [Mortierella antarctica]